ncbi:MAG TPA: hypothetical protein VJ224_02235 [Thermoplasmata archaeon]|nr:hypothetical protein [Thermoplasmata archaeon]
MSQNYQATGRVAVANLAGKHAYELLLLLGSALALLLSVVLYLIQWSQGIAANQLSAVTTVFVVDVVLGSALWLSAMIVRKNLANGALMAGVVSLILIAFGGQTGVIAGIIGFLGAALAAASQYVPASRRP